MLILYLHYKDKGYNSNDIPLTQLVLRRKSALNEEDDILEINRKKTKNIFEKLMLKVCVFLFDLYYILMIEFLQ